MDLYQLRYFLETARRLSFSRAAEALHVSPPAISKSVRLLERSLKKTLFVRGKRKVELTGDGKTLLAHAERIYDAIEAARLELEGKSRQDPGMIRIGSREMITNYLLAPSLIEFRRAHPTTRFGIYELDRRPMVEALHRETIDFAFHYYGDMADPDLEIDWLGFLPSHMYAARKLLRAAGNDAKTFNDVLRLPFIAPRYFGADPTAPSLDGFEDNRWRRNIQYEGELLETHRRFVLDGVAAAVLPDFGVAQERARGEVVALPGPRLGRDIFFLKRRGRPLPSAVDQFVASVRQTIRKLASSRKRGRS